MVHVAFFCNRNHTKLLPQLCLDTPGCSPLDFSLSTILHNGRDALTMLQDLRHLAPEWTV